MYGVLKEKLWAFIVHNNPDLMFELQQEKGVATYLDEKVSAIMPRALDLLSQNKEGYIIQEICMSEMTADLKPSRFNYILNILQQEFEAEYERLRENGLLTYETVNMVQHCKETFDQVHFSEENEEDRLIHAAVIGAVAEYIGNKAPFE